MASHRIQICLVTWLLLLTIVNCQQFVVPETISEGGQFSVFCDANRVTIPDPNVNTVTKLSIARTVVGATVPEVIAQYTTNPSIPDVPRIPSGRNWNITFVGKNTPTNNRNIMKSVLDVYDARCADAGSYSCSVTYLKADFVEATTDNYKNLTAVAGISDLKLSVTSQNPFGNTVFNDGDNISLTCEFYGPEAVRPQWQVWAWVKDPFGSGDILQPQSPPTSADLKTDVLPPPGSSACPKFTIKTTWTFQVTPNDHGKVINCTATYNNQVLYQNITLSVEGGGTPSPQMATAGSDPDVGMIVGIVIGCVVAIVIIILIVFFVMRYRRKKGENYKEDQRDAGNDNNLSAPPPVFYPSSKPSKGSKDEQDSKTLGESEGHDVDYSYKKDKKPRDRSPYYDDNYNHSQEGTGGRKNVKNRHFDTHHDKYYTQDEHHYASTDISQSGDESTDQSNIPLEGKSKPRPKRRSQVPRREDRDMPRPLHYAELDLPRKKDGSESGSDMGRKREIPVEYAEIRV